MSRLFVYGQGMNFKDPRSKLFFEYVRALKEAKPKYFLLENVKMKREWQDVISNELRVEPILINSSLVSAQSRERLYWTNIPNITLPEDKGILLCNVIDIVNRKWTPKEHYSWIKRNWGKYTKEEKIQSIVRDKAKTLTTSATHTNGWYFNDKRTSLTYFTADEAELLQTLPQGYTKDCGVADGKRFHAIGNAWTVDVIAHILRGLNNEENV